MANRCNSPPAWKKAQFFPSLLNHKSEDSSNTFAENYHVSPMFCEAQKLAENFRSLFVDVTVMNLQKALWKTAMSRVPERFSTSRSSTCTRSKSSRSWSFAPLWSFPSITFSTFPLQAQQFLISSNKGDCKKDVWFYESNVESHFCCSTEVRWWRKSRQEAVGEDLPK